MRLIRHAELTAKGIPWSRMHIHRLEKLGKFPRHIRLGASTAVWVESEIDEFLAGKFAAADRDFPTAA